MYLEERQEKILAILKEKRKISVGEMSEHFNVSGATIRTDLRLMEESGQLTRTHGGAILRTRASFEMGSDLRQSLNIDAKARIGERAAQLVEDGDIIVLDTGTTTLHIAHHLRERKNLTVITNDFAIARALEEASGVQLVLLGGMVKKGYHCVIPAAGGQMMDHLNVDKAFMAVNGISLKQGACVADIMLAESKHTIIEHASQVIVVCDSSKLGNTSLAQFARCDQVDMLVVDALPEDAEAWQQAGIALVTLAE